MYNGTNICALVRMHSIFVIISWMNPDNEQAEDENTALRVFKTKIVKVIAVINLIFQETVSNKSQMYV